MREGCAISSDFACITVLRAGFKTTLCRVHETTTAIEAKALAPVVILPQTIDMDMKMA